MYVYIINNKIIYFIIYHMYVKLYNDKYSYLYKCGTSPIVQLNGLLSHPISEPTFWYNEISFISLHAKERVNSYTWFQVRVDVYVETMTFTSTSLWDKFLIL